MTAKTIAVGLGLLLAAPARAQTVDLSPVQTLLQGIVDALTGPSGSSWARSR